MKTYAKRIRVGQLIMSLMASVLLILVSVSSQAKYANHLVHDEFVRTASASSEAITICYYRPRIYMGPSQRGFSITLDGHTSCEQEYNFGILYYVQHSYR